MADIPQVLATYDALVGVALGAGLTYGLGALNRRHQEAREDRTRWYETRLQAYVAIFQTVTSGIGVALRPTTEGAERVMGEITHALGTVRFVGSTETADVANRLCDTIMVEMQAKVRHGAKPNVQLINSALMEFQTAARKDLGHP